MADDQTQNQTKTGVVDKDDVQQPVAEVKTPEVESQSQTVLEGTKVDAPMPDWLKQAQALAQHEEAGVTKNDEPSNDEPSNVEPPNVQPKAEPVVDAVPEISPSKEVEIKADEVAVTAPQVEPAPEVVAEQVPATADVEKASEAVPAQAGYVQQGAEAPEGMIGTEEASIAMDDAVNEALAPVKTEQPAVEKEEVKLDVSKPALKVQDGKKAEVFDSAKDFFVSSMDKVQGLVQKGQTAGVPEKMKSKSSDGKKQDGEEVVSPGSTVSEKVSEVKPSDSKGDVKQKVTAEEKKALEEAEKIYQNGLSTIRDLIAPSSMEIRYDSLRVEGMYSQSFYVYAYPRYLDANWLSPVVNFDVTMDIAQFIYPIDSGQIMKVLRKKVAQMQSSVRMLASKGMVSDPALETSLQDAEELRMQIQRGQEKLFQFALYFTIYTEEEKKIEKISKQLESMLGGKLIMVKRADLQQEHAFNSALPLCLDELEVSVNMNTSPLSSTFPFTSSDLTSNEGILYGLNRHNDSLIIFDRFSLENANSVVFAKSGAGKSYAVKLEILRSMMVGTDVIVIDPENEYESLCQTVGGSYLKVSLTSERRINPFDLPAALQDEQVQPGDLLRSNIINLHGLLKIMLGGVNPEEEAILDKALIDVYALKGITMDLVDPSKSVPPTMEDLQSILSTMEGGQGLAQRLQKYTVGTYSGIFNKPTNVDMQTGLMVFSIRDLEDALRPIAMYIILNFIWARVRSQLKKRMLVIDEAWTMMQHDDSAKFLFGLVKRARKYYLGIVTITQDVEDFIKSPYGKPVVTNSSMQLLLKQAPSAVEILAKVFNLTEGERYMLLNSGVGQGLFFAGLKHVAIQIIASYTEDKIVTTNPEEILKGREDQFS